MIDHVLGRPSSKFRKVQVFAVVSFWSIYLLRGDKHGPPWLRNLSARLSKRFTLWQSVVVTLLWLYVARNFAKITGLESPEPLANLYSRNFFRATWITTALDAGFWSAMKIRNRRLRDIASIVFTAYYLIAAEQADEKVRKIRAVMTVDHLRISWDKPTTPYLALFTRLMRPHFTQYKPRKVRIPRPRSSMYKEPIDAWMYFNGTLAELQTQRNLVLDVPGGGFVAMGPRTSDDKLLAWAGKTNLPILSLDYRKAPEYPYPYALNECYDVYRMIVASRGRCVGIVGESCPRIVLTGDSAGGNLVTGTALMIIQSNMAADRGTTLPSPAGLVLMYPALDMNIGSWMTDDQMALIKNPRTARKHKNFVQRKSEDIDHLYTPSTPRVSDGEDEKDLDHDFFTDRDGDQREKKEAKQNGSLVESRNPRTAAHPEANIEAQGHALATTKPQRLKTRLAVSSILSYFGDRILTPEMMRAMIILYVGPYARPDFTTDHLLCPAVAPESLLIHFPKTYILTGERDPLVDDTVLFAGRLRHAKLNLFQERKDLGLEKSSAKFDEKKYVEVALIPGVSHGFVQFVSVYPDGWKHIFRCGSWIQQIFSEPLSASEEAAAAAAAPRSYTSTTGLRSKLGNVMALSQPGGSGLELNGSIHGGSIHGGGDSSRGNSVGTGAAGINGRERHHKRTGTSESSGDDDRPLEMSSIHSSSGIPHSSQPPLSRRQPSVPPRLKAPSQRPASVPAASTSTLTARKPGPVSSRHINHNLPLLNTDSSTHDDDVNHPIPISLVSSKDHPINKSTTLPSRGPDPAHQTLTQDGQISHQQDYLGRDQQQQQQDNQDEVGDMRGKHQRYHTRHKSGTTLGSEEDLLKRRMRGLTGSLMGEE